MSNSLQAKSSAPIEIIGEFSSAAAAEKCVDDLNNTDVQVQDVTVWNGQTPSMNLVVDSPSAENATDKGSIIMRSAISFSVIGLVGTLAIMAFEPSWGFFKHFGIGLTALFGALLGCMFGTLIGGVIAGSIREEETVVYRAATLKSIGEPKVEPRKYATEASIYAPGEYQPESPTGAQMPLSLVGKGKARIDIVLDEETYLKRISEMMLKSGASKVTMRFAAAA